MDIIVKISEFIIPVIVFAVKEPENIVKVINGEKIGSYVGVK